MQFIYDVSQADAQSLNYRNLPHLSYNVSYKTGRSVIHYLTLKPNEHAKHYLEPIGFGSRHLDLASHKTFWDQIWAVIMEHNWHPVAELFSARGITMAPAWDQTSGLDIVHYLEGLAHGYCADENFVVSEWGSFTPPGPKLFYPYVEISGNGYSREGYLMHNLDPSTICRKPLWNELEYFADVLMREMVACRVTHPAVTIYQDKHIIKRQ